MNALTTTTILTGELISPVSEARIADHYELAEKAASTRKAYQADMRAFIAWCDARGLLAVPADPETVRCHIAWYAEGGCSPSSIGRRISAIKWAHELAGHDSPTKDKRVRKVAAGIRREAHKNGYVSRRKSAATADKIRALLDACGDDMTGLRDRALLALGFSGAFRRSELVALKVSDLREEPDGLRIRIVKSKTDQMLMVRNWLSRAAPGSGRSSWCRPGSMRRRSATACCSAACIAMAACAKPASRITWWRGSSNIDASSRGSIRPSTAATVFVPGSSRVRQRRAHRFSR
jgi:integrase